MRARTLWALLGLAGCDSGPCDGSWPLTSYLEWDEQSPAGFTPRAFLANLNTHLSAGIPLRWAGADGCWDDAFRRDLQIIVEPGEAIGPPVAWTEGEQYCAYGTHLDMPIRVTLRTADGALVTEPGGALLQARADGWFRFLHTGLLTTTPDDTALAPGAEHLSIHIHGTVRPNNATGAPHATGVVDSGTILDLEDVWVGALLRGADTCAYPCRSLAAGLDTTTACRGCCGG